MAGFCRNCGAPYKDGARFCIECGSMLSEENIVDSFGKDGTEAGEKNSGNSSFNNEENGSGDAYSASGFGYQNEDYGNGYCGGYVYPMLQRRELNPLALILSVLNFFMCCTGIGVLFGGVGLFFAYKAKRSILETECETYTKVSVTINVVGIVLSLLIILEAFAYILSGGLI